MREKETYPLPKRNVSNAVCVASLRILKWISFLSTNGTHDYERNIANVAYAGDATYDPSDV